MIEHILSAIVFLPVAGAIVILLAPKKDPDVQRYAALLTTLVTFLLSAVLVFKFDADATGLQFVENHEWISSLHISYLIGVDGLSVALIPLTALLFLLAVIASWTREDGVRGYFSLLLLLETALLGNYAAQDLFLFFAFWEMALLPVYFMVGVWGNKNREYAATKFFLYQLAGSALILLGMLAIYYAVDPHSFSLQDLAGGKFGQARIDLGDRSIGAERLLFVLLLIGFAVRIPVFPLHSWFSHALVGAPSALAVILAAVFIKTGAYAIVRVNYALFPEASKWMAPVLAIAGTVNIIYGAICAFGQRDLRRVMAYSTLSYMGFVLLGLSVLSSSAFHGAMLQMVAHGIYAGLFLFLIGILGERSGNYEILSDEGKPGFGGLVSKAPILAGMFTVAAFSVLGVPGLGAFSGHALVFLGAFPTHPALTIIGLLGVFLTAGYLLWMYRRVFLGDPGEFSGKVLDVSLREQLVLIPLVVLTIFIGTYPTPLLHLAHPTVDQVLGALGKDVK